jgi:hypothetical protein
MIRVAVQFVEEGMSSRVCWREYQLLWVLYCFGGQATGMKHLRILQVALENP